MLVRLSSAIVGLLAFLGMLLAGYAADNPFSTILARALLGLLCGLLLGYGAGRAAQTIVEEHFKRDIQAEVDAELARQKGGGAESTGENKSSVGSGEDKEDGENSRVQPSALREQTVSAQAAHQALERT